MTKRNIFCISIFLLFSVITIAQKKPIKIEEENVKNRLILYAVNENLQDFDILVKVKGTGFRQRSGKPRLTRIPATSRVQVKSLVIERGKTPLYTYTIETNDSLSRRALRPKFTLIKIDPIKPILMYKSENCITCDTLISYMNQGVYKYDVINLAENPKDAERLKKYISYLDTITRPVFNLGGLLYINIKSYDQLLEKLKEEN